MAKNFILFLFFDLFFSAPASAMVRFAKKRENGATGIVGGTGKERNYVPMLLLCIIAMMMIMLHSRSLHELIPSLAISSPETERKEQHRRDNNYRELRRCFDNTYDEDFRVTTDGAAAAPEIIRRQPPCSGLKTLDEALARVELPCNYVHDGFYLHDSNVILSEIYSSMAKLLDIR